MPLELFVSRRAARDVERIVQWWAVNRPAAALLFRRVTLNHTVREPVIEADLDLSTDEK